MEKRPKSRPKAPIVSKRPKSKGDKPDPKSEENNWEELGDLELRADLEELLKKDPIARLGYDPKVIDYGIKGENAYYDKAADKVEYGSSLGSSKAVITHEFRHRGIKRLRDIIQDNPEYFIDNFGKDAVDTVLDMKEEKLVETYDHIEDKFIRGLDEEGTPLKEDIKFTVQDRNPHSLGNLQKGFDESKAIFGGESEANVDKYPNIHPSSIVPTSILRMAEQVLRDTGEIGQKPIGSTGTGKYNKGGAVTMEKQMSLFEEGGMVDDGMDVDPVSGNEVPPGSQAEEVRDDLDAKLSAGEYVVPADVVQYFGLKFFENLRSEAKGDLDKMDKEGRMGGEPSEEPAMGGEEELSPEEMAMLEEIMGGAPQGQPEMQMAEGGAVETPSLPASTFNPTDWASVGSSYGSGSATSAGSGRATYKTYMGPSGESRLILFVGGKPTTPIPEGFTLKETAAEAQQEKSAEDTEAEAKLLNELANRGPADDRSEEPSQSWGEANFNELSEDPIGFGMDALSGVGKGVMGAVSNVGLAGKALAGLSDTTNIASAKGAAIAAEKAGLDPSGLNAAIAEAEDKVGFASDIAEFFGVGDGSRNYESYQEAQAAKSASQTTTPSQTATATPAATPAETAPDTSGQSEAAPTGPSAGPEETLGGGEKAEGGLVRKPAPKKTTKKKTTPKKKGLASK